MKVKNMKGFTLAELLIVMAIIVVLAAVAIPTFGRQLETARESADMEVYRNIYTEALAMATLDAIDGKLDGKNGALSINSAGASGLSIASGGVVSATLANMKPAQKFSQGTEDWQYVEGKVAGKNAPATISTKSGAKFKFEIKSGDLFLSSIS